jgi:hypothetical protein
MYKLNAWKLRQVLNYVLLCHIVKNQIRTRFGAFMVAEHKADYKALRQLRRMNQ